MFTFIYTYWYDIVFVCILYFFIYSVFVLEDIQFFNESFDIRVKRPSSSVSSSSSSSSSSSEKDGGFCHTHHGNSSEIDKHCHKLSKNVCSHASCCVFEGNSQQCMAGNEHGPTFLTDDNDINIQTDYYYYKGKKMKY